MYLLSTISIPVPFALVYLELCVTKWGQSTVDVGFIRTFVDYHENDAGESGQPTQ